MKRTCPYDTSIQRMTKVYLKEHDVDRTALQKIQDDTLQRLLRVGRGQPKSPIASDGEEISLSNEDIKHYKQIEVTQYINRSSSTNFKQKVSSNNSIGLLVTEQCFYCENKALSTPCATCMKFYCESCTFVRYDKFGETYICISCA